MTSGPTGSLGVMTEDDRFAAFDAMDDVDTPVERPEATGVEQVDAVLDAVAAVGDRELAEQVVVFEQAHAALRRALDDPGPA